MLIGGRFSIKSKMGMITVIERCNRHKGWYQIYIILIFEPCSFFAVSFSLFQKIAVIVVAILVATTILGAMWASWGINLGNEWKEKGCK